MCRVNIFLLVQDPDNFFLFSENFFVRFLYIACFSFFGFPQTEKVRSWISKMTTLSVRRERTQFQVEKKLIFNILIGHNNCSESCIDGSRCNTEVSHVRQKNYANVNALQTGKIQEKGVVNQLNK